MKYFFLNITLLFLTVFVSAQNFDDYFIDRTLRIDYTFSGDSKEQQVSLNQLNQLPQWAGRRQNLSELLLKGNGQIKVTDVNSGTCIYMDAFSTLFQEWLTLDEAKTIQKSFENSFLIPYPKNKIEVEISLKERDGSYTPAIKHIIDPNDILIKKKGFKYVPPYNFIHQGGPVDKCVNVVIVGEGYTAEEMNKFREHAKTTCDAMFEHNPFKTLKDKFNFIAVEVPSKDSGVSVPREDKWNETPFHSHFDTFYSQRYLTTTHVKDVHDALAGVPYAHIIILANTDVYGGGGIFNSYTLTTTGHPNFKPVVVHEFGHSFGGLGDEYYYDENTFSDMYPLTVEPWEPNITTLVDFSSKWQHLLKKGTPIPTDPGLADRYPLGVFEGGGYAFKGIYRPAIDCRMKTNTCKDFCPACQDAIARLVKFYTE